MEFNVTEYTEHFHGMLGKDVYETMLKWVYYKLGYPQYEVKILNLDISNARNHMRSLYIVEIQTRINGIYEDYYVFLHEDLSLELYKKN